MKKAIHNLYNHVVTKPNKPIPPQKTGNPTRTNKRKKTKRPPRKLVKHTTKNISITGSSEGKLAKKDDNHPPQHLKDPIRRYAAQAKLRNKAKKLTTYNLLDQRTPEGRRKEENTKRTARRRRQKKREAKNPENARGHYGNPNLKTNKRVVQKHPDKTAKPKQLTLESSKYTPDTFLNTSQKLLKEENNKSLLNINNRPRGTKKDYIQRLSAIIVENRPLIDWYQWNFKPVKTTLQAPIPIYFKPFTKWVLERIQALLVS